MEAKLVERQINRPVRATAAERAGPKRSDGGEPQDRHREQLLPEVAALDGRLHPRQRLRSSQTAASDPCNVSVTGDTIVRH